MQAFAFEAPDSLDGALALLAEHASAGTRAQVLAGGSDLIVQMRSADRDPRTIVDIKRISQTRTLDLDSDGLIIGAAVPGAEITARDDLKEVFPGLLHAVDLIGSTQIQGRASVGGNLCNASPAGDTIPALIANGAVCRIASSNGTRELPVEHFVTGVGSNALAPDEMLVALFVPHPGERSGDGYLRFIPRTEMDIAVASAGVRVAVDETGRVTSARVGIGAVAPTALRVDAAAEALVGTMGDEEALQAMGAACSAASSPISDKRGTADYRRKVVAVLARRAAVQALARARGEDA